MGVTGLLVYGLLAEPLWLTSLVAPSCFNDISKNFNVFIPSLKYALLTLNQETASVFYTPRDSLR